MLILPSASRIRSIDCWELTMKVLLDDPLRQSSRLVRSRVHPGVAGNQPHGLVQKRRSYWKNCNKQMKLCHKQQDVVDHSAKQPANCAESTIILELTKRRRWRWLSPRRLSMLKWGINFLQCLKQTRQRRLCQQIQAHGEPGLHAGSPQTRLVQPLMQLEPVHAGQPVESALCTWTPSLGSAYGLHAFRVRASRRQVLWGWSTCTLTWSTYRNHMRLTRLAESQMRRNSRALRPWRLQMNDVRASKC